MVCYFQQGRNCEDKIIFAISDKYWTITRLFLRINYWNFKLTSHVRLYGIARFLGLLALTSVTHISFYTVDLFPEPSLCKIKYIYEKHSHSLRNTIYYNGHVLSAFDRYNILLFAFQLKEKKHFDSLLQISERNHIDYAIKIKNISKIHRTLQEKRVEPFSGGVSEQNAY